MADPLDLMNEHATLIGSVVIAYNKIHWVISVLFVAFSGMPAEEARDVFFALKSDRLQRDITLAAGKTALAEHPALWEIGWLALSQPPGSPGRPFRLAAELRMGLQLHGIR